MFDTMTMTKAVGALCGSLLVFLLGSWVADALYHTGGGHGDDHHQAYVVDTGDGEAAEADAAPVDFTELMAAADVGKGEKLWKKCQACHVLDPGVNKTGPSLSGIVGRTVGTEAGFAYSGALVAVADVWDVDHLNGFLENPKKYAPGTKMSFAGFKKPTDRANIIAFLENPGG